MSVANALGANSSPLRKGRQGGAAHCPKTVFDTSKCPEHAALACRQPHSDKRTISVPARVDRFDASVDVTDAGAINGCSVAVGAQSIRNLRKWTWRGLHEVGCVQVGQELSLFRCKTCMFESPEAALVHRTEELAEGFVTAGDGSGVRAAGREYRETVL